MDTHAFSSFAVKDTDAALAFYTDTLGLKASKDDQMGLLKIRIANGSEVMVYPKPDHQSATYTVLNFPVGDIDQTVDELTAKGVQFKQYDEEQLKTDEKGIARSDGRGPDIAWFSDPSGNIFSVIGDPSLKE
jgi:catechol 2,3-dioxygenase-like lactoylglutathione lyase family enzyme